jgi:hypothetical protein
VQWGENQEVFPALHLACTPESQSQLDKEVVTGESPALLKRLSRFFGFNCRGAKSGATSDKGAVRSKAPASAAVAALKRC